MKVNKMNHQPYVYRCAGLAALKLSALFAAVTLFMSGCSSIWNASDLIVWVQDRAVEQGCQRKTIELEEWYTKTTDGNVWRGTCRDTNGNAKSFGINVDPVWTPSKSPN